MKGAVSQGAAPFFMPVILMLQLQLHVVSGITGMKGEQIHTAAEGNSGYGVDAFL